jgi:hypothetical protein
MRVAAAAGAPGVAPVGGSLAVCVSAPSEPGSVKASPAPHEISPLLQPLLRPLPRIT